MPRQVVQRRRTVMQGYSNFLSNHPVAIISVIFLANIAALLAIILTDSIPVFDDPQAGFVPRGTLINQRSLTWRNFVTQIASDSSVSFTSLQPARESPIISAEKSETGGVFPVPSKSHYEDSDEVDYHNTSVPIPETQGYFCNNPAVNYARIIFAHSEHRDLLDMSSLRRICEIDELIRGLSEFRAIAENSSKLHQPCPSWTLANYITALAGKRECGFLNETDLQAVRKLMAKCLPFFRRGTLHDHCESTLDQCAPTPIECVKEDLIYHLLQFISDNESLENNLTEMRYSMGFLPVWNGKNSWNLLQLLQDVNLTTNLVQIVGMEMGQQERLFDAYLIHDLWYMTAALAVIVCVLWIYTASIFVTLMNVLATFFPLLISYIIYTFVLQLKFFPFMNLLTCVIMIAIGADALVIYSKLWSLAKTEKNDGKFEKVVYATVRQGSQAILVSSLTAAAALFADLVNPIVAIRCFSIFAGLTVLIHYLFMITWLPATVVIADKWGSTCNPCHSALCQKFCDTCSPVCHFLYRLYLFNSGLHYCCDCCRIFFEKILPCIIIRFKWMWTFVFLLLFTASCIVIFYYPKLQLPPNQDIQLWTSDHPFEQYRVLKRHFRFEKQHSEINGTRMPLRFIWGILPVSTGNFFDPYDEEEIALDPDFDLKREDSQKWMVEFCTRLKSQSFYSPPTNLDSSLCFQQSLKFCNADIFAQCVQNFSKPLDQSTTSFELPISGPKYPAQHLSNHFVIDFPSSQFFSYSYTEISVFHNQIDAWFQNELLSAPVGLRNGWFYSHLEFLDLQDSLISGTYISLCVSIGVAFLILFLTTMDLGASLLAILVVAGIMLFTIALLILMGWQLGLFEATVIGLAVGLSVDFTLHYAVSYCHSLDEDREMRTNHAIAEMASPVCVSALTTFLAGALMLPSQVLIYSRIAVFIMVVISASLIYATIFYSALLAVMGPKGDSCQFHYPSIRFFCCQADPSKLVEKGMSASMEFDSTITSSRTIDKHNHRQPVVKFNSAARSVVKPLIGKPIITSPIISLQATKTAVAATNDDDEVDSVGELGSVPTSRGPSRGASLVRKQGIFSWDYVMQKLPLSRHFSVAGSSVIYIDADVRSVASDLNPEIPALLPNRKEGIPEVWVRRVD